MFTSGSRRRVLSAAALVLVAGMPAMAQVQWRSERSPAPVMIQAGEMSAELTRLSQRPSQSHVVVEFGRPLTPAEQGELRASGVALLGYLSDDAYFARLDGAALDAGRAAAAAPFQSVYAIKPTWKLDETLARGEVPRYAVRAVSDPLNPEVSVENPIVRLNVMLHPDVSNDEAIEAMIASMGGSIKSVAVSINTLTIFLPFEKIGELSARDEVMWIEPTLVMDGVNDSNRARTQADIVQQAPYGLNGTGAVALIFDAGRTSIHQDYTGRMTLIDTAGTSDHATHVSGTVGGAGAVNPTYKGMAPNATLLSAGLEVDLGQGQFLYGDPGDIEADYTEAINDFAADIANNSIGNNTEPNGFPCDRQGNYGATDVLIDTIVRGGVSNDGSPFPIVWANGNERQGSRCDVEGFGDYYSIAPPAGAKNHITVGALNSNDDSVTSFTSWGPTDDGRMKPDISGPGCQSNGDGGVTSTVGTNGYASFCGTSMASPTVCGLSCLLLQEYRNILSGVPDPRGSTIKAIWAHTAQDVRQVGPDYETGYGSVRVQNAIDFLRMVQFTERDISQGETHSINVEVFDTDPELRMTLAWDDPPAVPNVVPSLVNNLDVIAFDPNNQPHYCWTLDPLNPGAPAVQTQTNTRDNIEQVFVANPMPGTWRVEIRGTSVPTGPQPYSLTGSPALDVAFISIGVPNGVPNLMSPGVAVDVDVRIVTVNDEIVAGSPTLHYRYDGVNWNDAPLSFVSGQTWMATLPAPECGDVPEFYFTAEGVTGGPVINPPDGSNFPYQAGVGDFIDLLNDGLEADPGWSTLAGDDNATTGRWVWGDPNGTASQPADDHTDPGSNCYFTGQGTPGGALGENDVDGGKTTLTSAVFDLSRNPESLLSYWRWYDNKQTPNDNPDDQLKIEISNNGSTWVRVETLGPVCDECDGGWFFHEFRVADFVPLSSTVQVRFIASDTGVGDIVEAAIDDIRIKYVGCEDTGCAADFDGNGTLNVFDFLAFQTGFSNGDPQADFDGNGLFNVFDFLAFQTAFSNGC